MLLSILSGGGAAADEACQPSSGSGAGPKECKFCFRTDEHEQPIFHLRAKHPRLCWRRPKGRVCAICPYVKDWSDELKSMSVECILEKIHSGPRGQEVVHGQGPEV